MASWARLISPELPLKAGCDGKVSSRSCRCLRDRSQEADRASRNSESGGFLSGRARLGQDQVWELGGPYEEGCYVEGGCVI